MTRAAWDFSYDPDRPVWDWSLMDFDTDNYIGSLNDSKNRSISPAMDAAGACSFDMSLDHDMAYELDPLSTYVRCQRNGVTKFEGKIYTMKKQGKANKVNVGCLGWFEELNHRYTITELLFSSMSIGQVAWSLVAHTIGGDGPIGFSFGPYQVAGFTLDAYALGADLNIASEIQKLTKVENGIDFYFDYEARMFKFVDSYGVDKPECHFGFKTDAANLNDCTETLDGTRIVTRMKAINPLSGRFVVVDNPITVISRGVYREVQSLTGLRATTEDEEHQNLLAYAGAETIVRGNPVVTYEIDVLPPGNNIDVPRPFDDFKEGDIVRLSADQGSLSLDNQPARCYGFTVNIGDNDEERLTSIALTP